MPLVIVIDGESASSSEIFAGAIRDHGRGTIVGTRSYGKGSIQGIFPLDVAGVGMRLTTAKFFSPNGHPYSGVGVEPHLAVHAVAKPVDGQASVATADPFIGTALEVARRSAVQPAVRNPVQPAGRGSQRPLPRPRSTASR
jgi:carboxyl-terminal processing protease